MTDAPIKAEVVIEPIGNPDESPSETRVAAAANRKRNPLAVAGFIVSSLGCVCFVFTLFSCLSLSAEKIEPNVIEGNILPPGSLSILHVMFVSAVGFIGVLLGGTISLIGFFLSLSGAFSPNNRLAIIGMIVAMSGPMTIALFLALIGA